jgi:hypothetical protein
MSADMNNAAPAVRIRFFDYLPYGSRCVGIFKILLSILGWLTYLGISLLGLAVLVEAAPAPLRLRREAVCSWWAGYSCLLACIKTQVKLLVAGHCHVFSVAAYEIFFNAALTCCLNGVQKTMRCLGVAARWISPRFSNFSNFFKINSLCYAPVLPRALPIWELYLPPNY